jgi:hypothetical protein
MSKLTELLDQRNTEIKDKTQVIVEGLEALQKATEVKPLETPTQESQQSEQESSVAQGQETKPVE